MPILDNREIRKLVERRVLEDSKDKRIFKGCRMIPDSLKIEQCVPEYNSFGNTTGIHSINGYVRVDLYSDETHSFLYPKRGKKNFSGNVASDNKLILNWQPSERV